MSGVITLDLNEVAEEWAERIAEMSASVPNTEGMSWGEVHDATEAFLKAPEQREFVQQYVDLCDALNIEPAEPESLKHVGITLIREDSFEDYAREYAEGMHGSDESGLFPYVDWERYADALRVDYSELEYDGHEWLWR